MTRYFKFVWLFFLTACSLQENTGIEDVFLEIDTAQLIQYFEPEGGRKSVPIFANSTAIKVVSSQLWCIPKLSNNATSTLEITVNQNASRKERTAFVTLSAGNASKLIVVKQPGVSRILSPSIPAGKGRTQIIAHRGYWNTAGASQNSLASLQNAIELDVYGSELDVWITSDDVLVISHNETCEGINIEQSSYAAIAPLRLSNGEALPTLQQCLELVTQQLLPHKTKLIIEIKSHTGQGNNKRCVDAVVKAVNDAGAADLVDYISFSPYVCEELIRLNPQHRVACLSGDQTPAKLKTAGYWGFDYNMSLLQTNNRWVNQAKAAGLTTNVWTVNTTADIQYFIAAGVDFITTDNPLECLRWVDK